MPQEKISTAQAWQVYSEVPGVLRALASERDNLVEKNASLQSELDDYRRRDRIEKIARVMETRGLNPGQSFHDKVEQIKEAADKGRSLDAIEEAVELTTPDGGIGKLGSDQSGNSATQLEAFILGDLSS